MLAASPRLAPTGPAPLVWVGGPAPTDSVHPIVTAERVEEVVTQSPLPVVLILDGTSHDSLEEQLALLRLEVLRAFTRVLVVDTLSADLLGQAALAGAFTCLPRAASASERDSLLTSALDHVHAFRRAVTSDLLLERAASLTSRAHFELQTLEEAEALAALLAACSPCPDRRIGGYLELLVNAIEHGNLEISGEQKRSLLREGRWHHEVECRLVDPRWAKRRVRATLERDASGGVAFCIEDDGNGFDVDSVLADDLASNARQHGRGIALARLMSFDELRFERGGTRVCGRISP